MSKKNDKVAVVEFFKGLLIIGKKSVFYIYHAGKRLPHLSRLAWVNILFGVALVSVWSIKNTPMWYLHGTFPDVFSQQFVRNIGMFWVYQLGFFLILLFAVAVFILAYPNVDTIKRIDQALKMAGLKNGVGDSPKVKDIEVLNQSRKKVVIDTKGVPRADFEKKRSNIRASVNSQIESIWEQKEPKYVDLFLNDKPLSKKVPYSEVASEANQPGEFVIGKTYGRLVKNSIFSVPHWLTAGATGMGKSYFLRQMMLNLLENTPNLQLIGIDLKDGIIMRPFKDLPNAKIVRDISEASAVLEKVHAEMTERFKVIEEKGCETINFESHKRDPILVVIDECSLLYYGSRVSATEKEHAKKATELTEKIMKLARVAGISMVLGTQKVTKDTIDTHIQENMEGRLCFKVPSIQGSSLVVGNKMARELPRVEGRAIFRSGVDIIEVQTPFLGADELKRRFKVVSDRFKNGKSPLAQKLITDIVRKQVKTSNLNKKVEQEVKS